MAWPPTPNTSYVLTTTSGFTIRWGTDGILVGYIVVSCTPADEVEPNYVENGAGMKCVRILLWQGRRVNITVVDDALLTPPTPGTTLTLFDPLSNGVSSTYRVLDNSYNAARKEAGQRVIQAEFLTMIEGGGAVPSH